MIKSKVGPDTQQYEHCPQANRVKRQFNTETIIEDTSQSFKADANGSSFFAGPADNNTCKDHLHP